MNEASKDAIPDAAPLPQTSPSKRWAFLAIPAIGLAELGAHVAQTISVVPESDWKSAREEVQHIVKGDDLVAFAPAWVDPVGRQYFGDAIATFDREARGDESRFPRAIEVGIRGKHLPAFAKWRATETKHVGGITLTVFENPNPAVVLDDLVAHLRPEEAHVTRVDGMREAGCQWVHTGTQAGGLGAGPATPGDRFNCPGAPVGVSILEDLEYRPRKCIFAPPPGGQGALRIEFDSVLFGKTIHGHHGLYAEAERDKTGAPVTLAFRVGDQELGSFQHHDGDGWASFDLDTTALQGQRAPLSVLISSPNGNRRTYCFEAGTR